MRFKRILATAACALGLSAVHAAVVTTVTQGSFQDAVEGKKVWIDDLQAYANELNNGDTNVALSFKKPTALDTDRSGNLSGSRGIQWVNPNDPTLNTFGRKSHDQGDPNDNPDMGSAYWEGGDGRASSFTVTFGSPVSAFGFWASDIGDFVADCDALDPGQRPASCSESHTFVLKVILTLRDSNGVESTFDYDLPPGQMDANNELFRGFTTDQVFLKAEFVNLTGGADGQGFDYFMVADASPVTDVPTPGGIGLAALGLLALARVTKRSRR